VRDSNTAVAVGARGVVVTTENGGERWTLRPTGIKDHLYHVAFAGRDSRTAGRAALTGASSPPLTAGARGASKLPASPAHLFSISFGDERTGVAVGSNGHDARHLGRRRELAQPPQAQEFPLTGVAFAGESKRAVAVGYGGLVLRTATAARRGRASKFTNRPICVRSTSPTRKTVGRRATTAWCSPRPTAARRGCP
jgi:photosystem II stability/assembly factor-like uncharacterized protein